MKQINNIKKTLMCIDRPRINGSGSDENEKWLNCTEKVR